MGLMSLIRLIRLMGRMGMVSNGNHYFNPNRFLCSNPNILISIVYKIVFMVASPWSVSFRPYVSENCTCALSESACREKFTQLGLRLAEQFVHNRHVIVPYCAYTCHRGICPV